MLSTVSQPGSPVFQVCPESVPNCNGLGTVGGTPVLETKGLARLSQAFLRPKPSEQFRVHSSRFRVEEIARVPRWGESTPLPKVISTEVQVVNGGQLRNN